MLEMELEVVAGLDNKLFFAAAVEPGIENFRFDMEGL